jgi:hypothetical protein
MAVLAHASQRQSPSGPVRSTSPSTGALWAGTELYAWTA